MQTDGNQRKLAEAEELEARAQALMQQFKDTATTTVKDINVSVAIVMANCGMIQGLYAVHMDLHGSLKDTAKNTPENISMGVD